MISDFRNKTAVLTGAGSGFGLECARIGAKLGEGTLAYVKAGYSNAGYEGAAAGYGMWAYEKGTRDGIRLGAGLEQRIADKWFVKGEYRYTRYGSDDVNRNQAIFGVGYRF